MAVNSSQETEDIWWFDENYGRSGDVIDSFSYWFERNSFWLKLALVGILVAAAWLIWTITVYRKEIRDIYSTSKVSFNRMFPSWRTFISRKQNGRQTRCRYKARYHQKGEESQVRLEIEKRSPFPNKQTRPTATNAQRGPYQKQTGTKRRTRIKIIDDIYGVIVGYQDPAGPSSHHQGREKSQVRGQQHETYRKELESFDSVGIQPRCHMKTVMEEKRVARKNSDAAIKSHLNMRTARSARSSMLSTPNSHDTPDMIRMRDIACRVKRERGEAYRARKARILKALEERQFEDLSETRV